LAGQALDYEGGRAHLTSGVPSTGPLWEWADSISPPFDIEGRNLLEALEWLSHEGGFQLIFTSPAARSQAATVVLHGSTRGLKPRDALNVVLGGTQMRHTIEGDQVRVGIP
jgi:hypothetical protein